MDVHIMHMMHILTECSTNKTYKRSSVDKERQSILAGVMFDLCDSGVTPLAIGAVACPTLIPGVVHVVYPRHRLVEIRRKERNESEISHSIMHALSARGRLRWFSFLWVSLKPDRKTARLQADRKQTAILIS